MKREFDARGKVLRTFFWSYFFRNWHRKNRGFLPNAVVRIAAVVPLAGVTTRGNVLLRRFSDGIENLAELVSYPKFASYTTFSSFATELWSYGRATRAGPGPAEV